MSTVYLFADSNLFLHYKPLHEIDWSKLSLSHKAESSSMLSFWIPAFVEMTANFAVFHTLSGWS